MIRKYFDITIAEYFRAKDIDEHEIAQADLVQIREYVSGGIYHSNSLSWRGNINGYTTPEEFIRSKKERKTLQQTLQHFTQQGYEFDVQPLTTDMYEEFLELYKETTLKRERALSFNLKEMILGKILAGIPVYIAGMYKDNKLESGLVFSVNELKKELLVSFGAKKKFSHIRGGVGGSLEYYLLEFALSHDIKEISHGRGLNPTGLSGKSGIFEFKARYGFTAFPDSFWLTTFIRNTSIALSDLVFVTIQDQQLAYLILADQINKEHEKKYKTREVSQIIVQSFEETMERHQAALDNLIRQQQLE